jgi:multidrug efflux pump subunit AcrA (membrane-fusion protein)
VRGKWLLIAGVVVVLAVGGAAISVLLRGRAASRTIAPAVISSPGGGTGLSLPGTIEAVGVVDVPVALPGKIMSLPVEVGDLVGEGQLLAEIRSSEMESHKQRIEAELDRIQSRVNSLESGLLAARLDAAKAQESAGSARTARDAAQKEVLRQQNLFSKGAAAKQTLERAQAAFDGATQVYEAQLRVQKVADDRAAKAASDLDAQQKTLTEKTHESEALVEQIGQGDLKSPIDGFVVARKGQVGDEVDVGVTDLFRITPTMDRLKAVVTAPQEMLERVRVGQEAILQIAEAPDGVVAAVTDVAGGQVSVEFPRPNAGVKPGLTVQVVIKLN